MRSCHIKSYVSSIFISFIEWFEFLVFIYIFLQIFKGENSEFVNVFQKIGILLSFIARPFGAYFFGKLSVVNGRISSLISTLNLMMISSLLIILATITKENLYLCVFLAIIARVLQGAAIGAEVTTSILYIYEISKNKATAIAFAGLGSALGMGFATYAPALLSNVNSVDNKIFISYGISIALSFIAYFIRKSLIETKNPCNNDVKIKLNKENLILTFNVFKYVFPFAFLVYYTFLVFPIYLSNTYNISTENSEYYLTYFSIFTGFVPILFGVIADRIGLDKVLKGTIISTFLFIPLFLLVKNPFFQINLISLLMSAYFAVGLTKLFTKTSIEKLYLSFPFLYNMIVAIISSQILLFFNINFNHNLVLVCFISIIIIFNFDAIVKFNFKEI